MKPLLRRLGRLADKALDAVIWLHDHIMLFICLLWLLPLIALVVVSAFIYDLRPLLKDSLRGFALYSLLGLPLWLGLCLYADFTATPVAHRIRHSMERLPVYAGSVLLGVGGLLWLLGVI